MNPESKTYTLTGIAPQYRSFGFSRVREIVKEAVDSFPVEAEDTGDTNSFGDPILSFPGGKEIALNLFEYK